MLTLAVIIIIVALVYDFLNGMNDAANSIATIVSTRVLSPRMAVIWAAFFNFAAIFVFGLSVANTIGKGIVVPEVVSQYTILASLLGAGTWVLLCTLLGMPISVSHALIGGLIGPALLVGGTGALVASGIFKILLFIVLSPLIGFILGYFIMVATLWICRTLPPQKVDGFFRVMQLVSSAFFSLGHGGNDAQKTMGIMAMSLYAAGLTSEFHVPFWVVISAYSAIALGTLIGGQKVIKTLGVGLTDLKPMGGFSAETAGALTLAGTALLGIPVSTTHTITGAIMGVGVTRRLSAIKWGTAINIVAAWVLTIPFAALMAMLVYWIMSLVVQVA
jgi:PiT family inorganic phosphate transporter